jgi:hypothetical protein
MLGAERLDAVAALLHDRLRAGDFDGCRGQLSALTQAASATCTELAELFPAAATP